MEAMLFAIDPALLPNLPLGFDIPDTCSIEVLALMRHLDSIVASRQLDVESCQSDSSAGENVTEVLPPTIGIVGASLSWVSVPVASLGRLFNMPQVS